MRNHEYDALYGSGVFIITLHMKGGNLRSSQIGPVVLHNPPKSYQHLADQLEP